MLKKANALNCQYVVRPVVGLSECADTVASNIDILKCALDSLDANKINSKFDKFKHMIQMFNSESSVSITLSDVHHLLKYLISDEEDSDDTFSHMEHLGMLLYTIGCHHKQLSSLVRNPKEYSHKCDQLPSHPFKTEPSIKSLKAWWASEVVMSTSKPATMNTAHRRNLLKELGSDSDSDDEEPT